jgi:hypothetical protein
MRYVRTPLEAMRRRWLVNTNKYEDVAMLSPSKDVPLPLLDGLVTSLLGPDLDDRRATQLRGGDVTASSDSRIYIHTPDRGAVFRW